MRKILGKITHTLLLPFLASVKGQEHIPPEPFIAVANHASFIDGILLYSILAKRNIAIHFVIVEWMYNNRIMRWFLNWMQQIKCGNAVQKCLHQLEQGKSIGIFAEGKRSRDGTPVPIVHSGAGVVALLTGAPLLPVTISGTHRWWGFGKMIPTFRKQITIVIHKPLRYPKKKNVQRGPARNIVREVMKQIYQKI